jgi:hypothetical protein
MISQVIGKGTTILNQQEFNKVPELVADELPNVDMYPSLLQFKMIGMDGNWLLFDIIHVNGEDEIQQGVNILVTRIEVEIDD